MTELQVTNRMRYGILTFLFLLFTGLIVSTSLIGVVSAQTLVSISPLTQQIDEGQSFTISVYVEPDAPASGGQLNLQFDNSLVNVINITEGNLLNQDGASTIFNSGTIDNSQGTVTDVYAVILGKSNVTSSGTFLSIDLVALNKSGTSAFELSDVIISNSEGQSLPITTINGNADVGDGGSGAFDPMIYDINKNGTIEKSEVFTAIADYFDYQITKAEVFAVIGEYFR